ncbi:MAG: hypothetical protein GVY20_12900 [Bacteroidetes bacterium]|jgi:hypothetical protein|nr:hypothetical protein [Bacteroidota bacterium]
METIKIDILNPKARKLLNDLAELDLIAIRKSTNKEFSEVVQKIRSKSDKELNEDEIAQEVEAVRKARSNK